jgi:NADH-quinone oxidoreductase subunit L
LGGSHFFSAFLGGRADVAPVYVTLTGMAAPLAGIALAYALHANGFWRRQAARAPGALRLVARSAFGFDAAYRAVFVRPFLAIVRVLRNDPVDALFDGIARLAVALHEKLRAAQNGKLRRYAGWMMAGSLATFLVLVFA